MIVDLPTALGPELSPAAARVADAAIDVVAAEGHHGLSIRAVAARAGLTGGAVQHHFPTKSALLEAAFLRTVKRISDRVVARLGSAGPRTVLTLLVEEVLPFDEVRRRECVVWLALSAAAATDDHLAALHRAVCALFEDVLEQARRAEDGPVRPNPLPMPASAMLALIDGLTLQALTGARSAEDARDIILEVLRPSVSTTRR